MRPIRVYYKKLSNLGNFENEEVGVKVQVDEVETATEVLRRAQEFIPGQKNAEAREKELQTAKRLLSDPDKYLYSEVQRAKEFIEELNLSKPASLLWAGSGMLAAPRSSGQPLPASRGFCRNCRRPRRWNATRLILLLLRLTGGRVFKPVHGCRMTNESAGVTSAFSPAWRGVP